MKPSLPPALRAKLEVAEISISTEHLKEAILFAVANGWRPLADAHFSDEEAPTAPFEAVSP